MLLTLCRRSHPLTGPPTGRPHVHPVPAQRRTLGEPSRPRLGRRARGACRRPALTTRCQGTPPPCRAMIAPTSRAEARPERSASASATAPYDITRPGGIRSTSSSTASTYSSGVTAGHDMGGEAGVAAVTTQNRRVRDAVTTARRVVVKIGSSSLTTATGGLDDERLDTLVDALGAPLRRRARGGARLLRRDRRRPGPARAAPATARPGHPAGRRQRRPGPADRPVRRRPSPGTAAPSARCCSPSTT